MIHLNWDTPPIGLAYEKYAGKTREELSRRDNEGEMDHWVRGVENWKALLRNISYPQPIILSTLSTAQRRSLRLLVEWWEGAYEYEKGASDMRDHLLRDFDAVPGDDPFSLSKNPEYRKLNITELDGYGARLFELWQYEFLIYEQYETTSDIQLRRALASRVAATQRVAFGALAHHAPEIWGQTPAKSTILHSLEAFDNGLPVGGLIEACPWLSKDQRTGLPFFLWDVENKRTVKTEDLPGQPVYTVISHTWGRWRLKNEPNVAVPGVPWSVPQNSRFSVQELPNILARKSEQFLPATYIWFDLFCIPQDRSELQKREIARQAAIFGGAYRAIAWLNYVEDWDGLVSALQYMVSYWLDREPNAMDRLGRRALRPHLNKQPGSNAKLWSSYSHREDSSFYEVDGAHGWFTSLWTLQELYLRPDMLLADRDWDICHYPGVPSSQPLTIDTLVAIFWTAKPYIIAEACTIAVEGLCALMMGAGMDQLLEPHPLSPLCLGSRRQCTGRRAEAIMSVVGATRWYQDVEDANKNLVLGHYPVAFLRELHGYLGATFFRTVAMQSSFWDVMQKAEHKEDGKWIPHNAGGMLPFDIYHPDSKLVSHIGILGATDHPTTATWEIGDHGEVYMTDVAIVASTDDEFGEDTDHDLVAHIHLPTGGSSNIVVTTGNLHEALRAFAPSFMKHAICLREREDGWCEGVILLHIHDVLYAKIGDFTVPSSGSSVEYQEWGIGQWEVI